MRARVDDGGAALPLVLTALDAEGVTVASATVSRPSLDDVYLAHTGHSFAAVHAGSSADARTDLEEVAS